MKFWTLLTSTAAVFFAVGFFLLGGPLPATTKATRTSVAGMTSSAEDEPASRAERRYRQSLSNHWRTIVMR